jgi:hypothetical protein
VLWYIYFDGVVLLLYFREIVFEGDVVVDGGTDVSCEEG